VLLTLLIAGSDALPWLRASVSQLSAEPSDRTDGHVLSDRDAIDEAHIVWDHPPEKIMIWDKAVVARTRCPEPFTSNVVQGTIEESRVSEAYAPFGWTFSPVLVDCRGETDRS